MWQLHMATLPSLQILRYAMLLLFSSRAALTKRVHSVQHDALNHPL